ncbi:hypothetical protein Scep_005441 [Stephania cephalantha]|uniref:Uncharacterized protein n=1 Tax=Stephania cephalantha TaxID=152367 RepID=A0AAP0KW13_9MAGN
METIYTLAVGGLYRFTETTNQRIFFDIEPYGRHLGTCGQDGQVHIYDLLTGQWTASFQAAADTVNGFCFHPHLPMAASSSGHRRFGMPDDLDEDFGLSILNALQRRRQELTQTTPDQLVDDEAVYYKVAGDCPKGCVYGLRSLWRKNKRYVDPDASTSQVLAQRGMGNFMILSNGSETELLYSVSAPLLIRDGSETEYNNSVSDPLLIRDGSDMECNYNCTI